MLRACSERLDILNKLGALASANAAFFKKRCQAFVGVLKNRLFSQKKMEPMIGFEPMTDGLRNRCSTAELHWRKRTLGPPFADGSVALPESGLDGKLTRQLAGTQRGKCWFASWFFGWVGIADLLEASSSWSFSLLWGLICLAILAGFGLEMGLWVVGYIGFCEASWRRTRMLAA